MTYKETTNIKGKRKERSVPNSIKGDRLVLAKYNNRVVETDNKVLGISEDVYVGLLGGGIVGGVAAGPAGALVGSVVGSAFAYIHHHNG
jgi:hypothetical protein